MKKFLLILLIAKSIIPMSLASMYTDDEDPEPIKQETSPVSEKFIPRCQLISYIKNSNRITKNGKNFHRRSRYHKNNVKNRYSHSLVPIAIRNHRKNHLRFSNKCQNQRRRYNGENENSSDENEISRRRGEINKKNLKLLNEIENIEYGLKRRKRRRENINGVNGAYGDEKNRPSINVNHHHHHGNNGPSINVNDHHHHGNNGPNINGTIQPRTSNINITSPRDPTTPNININSSRGPRTPDINITAPRTPRGADINIRAPRTPKSANINITAPNGPRSPNINIRHGNGPRMSNFNIRHNHGSNGPNFNIRHNHGSNGCKMNIKRGRKGRGDNIDVFQAGNGVNGRDSDDEEGYSRGNLDGGSIRRRGPRKHLLLVGASLGSLGEDDKTVKTKKPAR